MVAGSHVTIHCLNDTACPYNNTVYHGTFEYPLFNVQFNSTYTLNGTVSFEFLPYFFRISVFFRDEAPVERIVSLSVSHD